jgi:signal transduction histidine kinase
LRARKADATFTGEGHLRQRSWVSSFRSRRSEARTRIIEAAQTERKRLERDLHDGAQQRLVALSLELGLLEERFAGDADAKAALEQTRREVTESLRELRELAQGIHPAVVTGHGLAVALKTLAARAQVPVRLTLALDARLPERQEVAAYYVVAESLTNVAKYASASSAAVEVATRGRAPRGRGRRRRHRRG